MTEVGLWGIEDVKSMSERIESFLQLRVYQAACALDLAIFAESKAWPREELYSLTDQVRRSSRSIGANIVSGHSKPASKGRIKTSHFER